MKKVIIPAVAFSKQHLIKDQCHDLHLFHLKHTKLVVEPLGEYPHNDPKTGTQLVHHWSFPIHTHREKLKNCITYNYQVGQKYPKYYNNFNKNLHLDPLTFFDFIPIEHWQWASTVDFPNTLMFCAPWHKWCPQDCYPRLDIMYPFINHWEEDCYALLCLI